MSNRGMNLGRLAACALVAGVGTAASADVIISNLAVANTTGTVFGTCSTAIFKAGGFTMPAGTDYTLDMVIFNIDYNNGGGGELGQYALWQGSPAPTTFVTDLLPLDPQVGIGNFRFEPASAVTLEQGVTYWVRVAPSSPPGGCMMWTSPPVSTGAPTGIATNAGYNFNGSSSSFWNKYEVQGTPASSCYADCDTSTGIGVLDIFDFLCFGNRFSANDPYACDCDTSTGVGVCDIFDFLCFGNEFNAGCP